MMGFKNTWIIGGNETRSELEIKNDIINKLQFKLALAREGLEFYSHEQFRSGYGYCGVMMPGHKFDISCTACDEQNRGKKAREILAQLDKKEQE